MPGGRDTITRRTHDIHKAILKPGVVNCVHNLPFLSLVADESTDSATKEQLGVYVRYFGLDQGKLVEEFLEMKQVIGHPDANNYILNIEKAHRFPELDFTVQNSFRRSCNALNAKTGYKTSPVQIWHRKEEPFEFDTGLLSSQYRIYENDVTIDFQYQLRNKDYVKFWCQLYRGDEYKDW